MSRDPHATCRLCHGGGSCVMCQGTGEWYGGEEECGQCRGTKLCARCRGSGREPVRPWWKFWAKRDG